MELLTLLAPVLGALFAAPNMVTAIEAGDAANMFDAWNNAFLTTGSSTFYKAALDETYPDGNWVAALDILGAEDAYEVTGETEYQTLINNLLVTWIANNEPPWTYVNFNDDIGWYTLALIRGYRMTGNTQFLTEAEYGFNYAYGRGWDTTNNGGGIFECQPAACGSSEKDALSNDSLGKVACILYQSTHNSTYLNYCTGIYDWVWNHLYNPATGAMNWGVQPDGSVDTSINAYDQGTWLDYAGLVYEITGNGNVKNDAQKILEFAMSSSLTTNGIFSNDDPSLNTWADDMARGVARYLSDNRLWANYYSWVVDNANSILANRRADLGVTWNAWNMPSPEGNTQTPSNYVSAVAWLWWTPVTMPDARVGLHTITNKLTGLALDSAGNFGNGNDVVQWAVSGSMNQQWQLTQNLDTSWNIINTVTWEALDCGGGSTNGQSMIQWQPNRNQNQRWWIDEQPDGSYKIWNQGNELSLDGASATTNGAPLEQWTWNGGSQQLWILG